jgi:hypothetical protein
MSSCSGFSTKKPWAVIKVPAPVLMQRSDIWDICKIWGFHGGDYEEWCLLGCYAVWLL